MSERAWNFSPGPGALPLPVLEQIHHEIVELPGAGASILEISHRSTAFERVIEGAEANLRDLLSIPDPHRVLFLQGGASLPFAMVPMNLMLSGADYVVMGRGARRRSPRPRCEATRGWCGTVPRRGSRPRPRHWTGSRGWPITCTSRPTRRSRASSSPPGFEPAGGPPLVCDASSDFLSRPIPVQRYGLLFAGAQKNAGPAGLTVVVIRDDLLETIPEASPRCWTTARTPSTVRGTSPRRCSRSTS